MSPLIEVPITQPSHDVGMSSSSSHLVSSHWPMRPIFNIIVSERESNIIVSERESNCVSLPRAGINCTESLKMTITHPMIGMSSCRNEPLH